MKSKNITTIILEGSDGVGKDSVAHEMWQVHDKHFRVYVRGELSDYFYAKKYNRPFISTQRGLPFIYVLLTADKEILRKRICEREYESEERLQEELEKVNDQEKIIKLLDEFSKDYHVITIDTSNKSIKEVAETVWTKVQEYQDNLAKDPEINEYNKMYKRGCDKLGLKFYVRDNQPFIDNNSIMADAQLHNGSYETFDDKTMPHNFIFSLGYDDTEKIENTGEFDFSYIIGSKIAVRQEVNDYFTAFKSNNLSCMTRETYSTKVFGNDYLKRIAKSKATVYCCRDLAYLEMITVRPYEAALASQIMFVDKQTDPECKILRQIYTESDELYIIDKLYVTPDTIAENYRSLTNDDIDMIITAQKRWYNKLKHQIERAFQK